MFSFQKYDCGLNIFACLTGPFGVLLDLESGVETMRHNLQNVIEVQDDSLTLINVIRESV
jgi:hypothetical protein